MAQVGDMPQANQFFLQNLISFAQVKVISIRSNSAAMNLAMSQNVGRNVGNY